MPNPEIILALIIFITRIIKKAPSRLEIPVWSSIGILNFHDSIGVSTVPNPVPDNTYQNLFHGFKSLIQGTHNIAPENDPISIGSENVNISYPSSGGFGPKS